jgi:hypothetical protein
LLFAIYVDLQSGFHELLYLIHMTCYRSTNAG